MVNEVAGARIGIISVGSNDGAIKERSRLRNAGIETSYFRVRALPIDQTVRAFTEKYDTIYVVENNLDGQLHNILVNEMPVHAAKMISTSKCDGMPLSARWITEQINQSRGYASSTLCRARAHGREKPK